MNFLQTVAARRPRAILVVLCLGLYVPGLFSLPPLDRDESRFAQASKQMLETGDFINIRFLDGARNKKPAGIHWMQAVVASLAGGPEEAGIWAYRLPSVIGAILAVLLLHWAACRLFDPPTALLAAALLATSISVVAETNISKTDGMLLATIVAMNGILAQRYVAARAGASAIQGSLAHTPVPWGMALAFWFALAVSLLLKGPIGPMVIGLTILALSLVDRDFSWLKGLRPVSGFALTAALVLPWAIAIYFTTQGVYYQQAIGHDLIDKVISAQESHGAPPGYYFLLASVTFFPGSLFLWPSLWRAWEERTTPAIRFGLAWLIPTWIAFECFPTKLPHYSMPTYPALALLTAAAVMAAVRSQTIRLSGVFARITLIIWVVLGLVLAAAASVLPIYYGDGLEAWSVPLSLVAGALVLAVAVSAWRGRFLAASATSIVAALVLYGSLLEITLPNLDRLGVSPKVKAFLEEEFGPDAKAWPRLASVGFHEPSLVFLTRTDTRLGTAEEAAGHLAENASHIALIEKRNEAAFQGALEQRGLSVVVLGRIEGHNYSNGRDVEITLYRQTKDSGDATQTTFP